MATTRNATCRHLNYLPPFAADWRAFASGWLVTATFFALMVLAA